MQTTKKQEKTAFYQFFLASINPSFDYPIPLNQRHTPLIKTHMRSPSYFVNIRSLSTFIDKKIPHKSA